jgi:hypothetical protein
MRTLFCFSAQKNLDENADLDVAILSKENRSLGNVRSLGGAVNSLGNDKMFVRRAAVLFNVFWPADRQ